MKTGFNDYEFKSDTEKLKEEISFETYLEKYCNMTSNNLNEDDFDYFMGEYENFIGTEIQRRKREMENVRLKNKLFKVIYKDNNFEVSAVEMSGMDDSFQWQDIYISQYGDLLIHGHDPEGHDVYRKIDRRDYDVKFYESEIDVEK